MKAMTKANAKYQCPDCDFFTNNYDIFADHRTAEMVKRDFGYLNSNKGTVRK